MNGIDFIADTNILIYTLEGHPGVKAILPYFFAVSVISEIELLGKTGISDLEKEIINELLNDCQVIELNPDNALELRYESLTCNKSAPYIRNS